MYIAKLNQYDRAIQDYSKAIELGPGHAIAYYNRGNVYIELNQPIKAIKDYNKAIELNPGFAAAYNNRGSAYMMLQKVSRGCLDLKKACELGICSGLELFIKEGGCL